MSSVGGYGTKAGASKNTWIQFLKERGVTLGNVTPAICADYKKWKESQQLGNKQILYSAKVPSDLVSDFYPTKRANVSVILRETSASSVGGQKYILYYYTDLKQYKNIVNYTDAQEKQYGHVLSAVYKNLIKYILKNYTRKDTYSPDSGWSK